MKILVYHAKNTSGFICLKLAEKKKIEGSDKIFLLIKEALNWNKSLMERMSRIKVTRKVGIGTGEA